MEPKGHNLHKILAEISEAMAIDALKKCDGNVSKACRYLSITRKTMYLIMRRIQKRKERENGKQ